MKRAPLYLLGLVAAAFGVAALAISRAADDLFDALFGVKR